MPSETEATSGSPLARIQALHGIRTVRVHQRLAVGRRRAARWMLGLLLFIGLEAFAAAPAGSWWNTAYGHRFSVSIATGASALPAGYSISVDINHASLVAAGRSLANGDDLRVAYWDGSTWTELDRVLDVQSAWNGAATRIWFATEAIVGANSTEDDYYVYYGNTAAGTPPQDGDQVYLLYDTFSAALSAARWTAGGGRSLSAGVLTLDDTGYINSVSVFGTNTLWEARVRIPEELPSGGDHQYYYWMGAANSAPATTGAAAGFYTDVNNEYVITRNVGTTQSAISPGTPTNWQTYSFFRNGATNVQYRINGSLVSTLGSNVSSANFRAVAFNDANGVRTVQYDWVRVRRYVSTQPTVTQAVAEQYARLAHWRMEQTTWNGTSGEVLNSEAGSPALTATGATTAVSTPAIAGNPGTCRYGVFDGVNDYLQTPDSATLEPSTRLTAAVWVYPRALGSGLKSILSKDTTYEFHLNAAGQVNWWWGGGSQELTTATTVPLNAWTHIAITYQPGEQRIYVNGVLRASASVAGTLSLNNLPFQIGQDQGIAERFWNGYIDEVALYNRALSAAEVGTLMSATYPCTGAAPKFVITHDEIGIHCLVETVRVDVRDAANNPQTSYTQNVTLTTNNGAGVWSVITGSGTLSGGASDDGVATYQWPNGQSYAEFGLYYPSGNPVVDVDVYQTSDSSVRDDESEDDLVFSPSGFTVTSSALSNPPPAAIPAFTSPQTAGTSFPIYITAYGQTPTDSTCGVIEGYTGAKNIKLWSTYVNPASGTRSVTINGTTIPTNASTTQSIVFTNGQASVTAKYKDVGSISINARDDGAASAIINGGTGPIVVKPSTFVVTNLRRTSDGFANPGAVDANGAIFATAGAAFSATVTSRDSEGDATPNYGRESPAESVSLTPILIAPAGGVSGTVSAPVGFGAFANGAATGTDFSWNEVGVVSLSPRVWDGSYLGAGDVIGTSTGAVGRFTPARFDVAANTPMFNTACPAGGFTYVGQPLTYLTAPVLTVTALSSSGSLTQNYRDEFFKLTQASLFDRGYDGGGVALNTSGVPAAPGDMTIAAGAGIATLTFNVGSGLAFARGAPIPPFDAQITLWIDIVDADDVKYPGGGPDLARYTIGSPSGIAFTAGSQHRFGRVAFRNAVGSELINLAMQLRAEYFYSAAAGFVAATTDSCSAVSSLTFATSGGNLATSETCVLDGGAPGASGLGCSSASATPFRNPAVGGDFNLILRAPGAGNDGTLTIRANAPTWLRFNWDAASAGDENPSGVATFGVFQGSSKRIYQRETVR